MATKKFFNLNNPEDVAIMHDLLFNGDLSDMEDIFDEEDCDVVTQPEHIPTVSRIGSDCLRRVEREEEVLLDDIDLDDPDDPGEPSPSIEEDPLPLSSSFSFFDSFETTRKDKIKWKKRSERTEAWTPPTFKNSFGGNTQILNPIEYFTHYITDSLIDKMCECTNLYIIQNDKSLKLTNSIEIKHLLGLHIIMGSMKLPRIHLYWDKTIGIDVFKKTMSRDRFKSIRSCLHVVNNMEKPKTNDSFWKVRPLYDEIKIRCNSLDVEEEVCVDEQIVPFKGRHTAKQYVKGKPCPWGIKLFILCGKSGTIYDFLIYQGSTTELNPQDKQHLGLGASVVLHLSKVLQPGHSLYFDNFFTSYNLLQILRRKGIKACGTARQVRFREPPFTPDKMLQKKGRGSSEELISHDGDIHLTKWLDNKCVTMASNFLGIGVEDEVKRWDKVGKKNIIIKRPEVIKKYNHSMGGVDLLDQMVSLYRIFIRSKKWTLRMMFHGIDLAVANAWFEYRKDCAVLKLPQNKILDLLHFRMDVASGLLALTNQPKKKRGRPSSFEGEMVSPDESRTPKRVEHRPHPVARYNDTSHIPVHDEKKNATRCKFENCKFKTNIYCSSCLVHLCINRERNCYKDFHTTTTVTCKIVN